MDGITASYPSGCILFTAEMENAMNRALVKSILGSALLCALTFNMTLALFVSAHHRAAAQAFSPSRCKLCKCGAHIA